MAACVTGHRCGLAWAVLWLVLAPRGALAGGGELAGDGTRGLGRGGTGFLRADDPTVMLRNPALLADLWDDQAMLHSHLLLQDACFQPIGPQGWDPDVDSVIDLGEGPLVLGSLGGVDPNDPDTPVFDQEGRRIVNYGQERFDEVCFEGPNLFLPGAAVTVKLAHDLGVGLGFFPPDAMRPSQFGNADGTVDTPRGKRPAQTRFLTGGSNQFVSFFSLLGGIGWRPAPWLRVGAGFQWSLVAINARAWGPSGDGLDPGSNVRADVFGRDLFVPGVLGSVHVVPHDALDLAVGFKWSDRIRTNAKLDFIASPWGLDTPFSYRVGEDGELTTFDNTPTPLVSHNRSGAVSAPPIWSPQLSLGVRFADRLKPRPEDWRAAHATAAGLVDDHMTSELWDIEITAIYYMNGARDHTDFDQVGATATLGGLTPRGTLAVAEFPVGRCTQFVDPDATVGPCAGKFRNRRVHGGRDQYSIRLGGDYNLLPGLLALRAGVSYETDGIDPEFWDPTQPDQQRVGLHAGITVRIADRTDLSLAYALFLLKDMDLGINEEDGRRLPGLYRVPEYGFAPADPANPQGDAAPGTDGIARYEVAYESDSRTRPGPFFANAGSGFYNLGVLSASVTQHF